MSDHHVPRPRSRSLAFDPNKLIYDSDLPIVRRRHEIMALLEKQQVLVLCGETGSGKSTQLPKICLEIGRAGMFREKPKLIGHTQPRRIAARSVAARIAEELTQSHGPLAWQFVGSQVRFHDQTGPETRVKLMTDGILLAESQSDPFFHRYDTIIIDEAHERSLNIDFLLGMLKRVLPKRPELKLIITSATIDAVRFAEHFRTTDGLPAPVIEVTGRTFPIDILYRPPGVDAEGEELDPEEAVLRAVNECAEFGRGDILIFLPTERDILETARILRSRRLEGDDAARKSEILPLYARLPTSEQQRIFQKSPHRKIVIATNVAESSLTVPGIRFVIDSGTARISRYSGRSRTQRLPIEPISQASADQRAGRCGRVGPGICIRLYEEKDYAQRSRYTTPEIQRTNLASVILRIKSLRLGAIEKFPFLDPPQRSAVTDGYKTLHEIGALDRPGDDGKVTAIGRRLAKLPVDPRIGRMLLAAEEEGCLPEMMVVAAALEIQDPRERPQEHQQQADAAHEKFLDASSDFLVYLNIWNFYRHLKDTLSRNQLRKGCVRNFLSFNRMKEWSDIHIQLLAEWHEATGSRHDSKRRPEYQDLTGDTEKRELARRLHRSVLTGLLSGIARREDRGEYGTAGGARFLLWPGSVAAKGRKNHHWIVAAERVETTRRFLRTVAPIETGWIEPLAAHLLQRVCLEPHWSRETGYVHAYERVSLFGLTIVPKRRINFGPIDPKQARDLFIQSALVEEEFDCTLPFFEHNRRVLEEAKTLQSKLRRHDLLLGQYARYDFYQRHLPDAVYDHRSLEAWWKEAPEERRRSLFFSLSDICAGEVDQSELRTLFPDRLETPAGTATIEYAFKPGEEDDGLSVLLPLEGIRQWSDDQLGWLVPGMLEQKVVALLRSLPKDLRRPLVPVTDTARSLGRELLRTQGSLEENLARAASRLSGQRITPSDFRQEELPAELRMNVKVLDPEGTVLAQGRSLDTLRKELGVRASEVVLACPDPRWNRDGVTSWDFGVLPESVTLERGGLSISAFPGLRVPETPVTRPSQSVPRDSLGVSLRLFDTREKAERATRLGLVRLFYLKAKREIDTQVAWIPKFEKLNVYAARLREYGNTETSWETKRLIGELIAARALGLDEKPLPRSEGGTAQCFETAGKRLGIAVQEVTRVVVPLFESGFEARLLLEQQKGRFEASRQDASNAMNMLTSGNFLLTTPWLWLKEFPRYFKAVGVRFEKLKNGGEVSDRSAMTALGLYWEQYLDRLAAHEAAGLVDEELATYRWMLEEYRVSLFAQKLGTNIKVSPQRLQKQWEKIR